MGTGQLTSMASTASSVLLAVLAVWSIYPRAGASLFEVQQQENSYFTSFTSNLLVLPPRSPPVSHFCCKTSQLSASGTRVG